MRKILMLLVLSSSLCACSQGQNKSPNKDGYSIQLSEAEWKQKLSDEEYRVLREKGTEAPWSGEYNNFKKEGYFVCSGCGDTLFVSDHKFDSGSGWPSFYDVYGEGHIDEVRDESIGMVRTEVVCGQCGGHLGHKFNDGPQPTGQRYCVNSVCLKFIPIESGTK